MVRLELRESGFGKSGHRQWQNYAEIMKCQLEILDSICSEWIPLSGRAPMAELPTKCSIRTCK